MKIIYKAYAGGGDREFSIESAIHNAATPDPYSYNGQLEKLAAENEKLRGIVGRLLKVIVNGVASRKEAVEYILGYGYEVSDD